MVLFQITQLLYLKETIQKSIIRTEKWHQFPSILLIMSIHKFKRKKLLLKSWKILQILNPSSILNILILCNARAFKSILDHCSYQYQYAVTVNYLCCITTRIGNHWLISEKNSLHKQIKHIEIEDTFQLQSRNSRLISNNLLNST